MTKDMAGLLSANYMIFDNKEKGHLQTVTGTKIIVGSGYTGSGPDSQTGATASATNKWMYGTGTIKTLTGDVDVVADNLAQSYDVAGNQNDMRVKAIRPAAVYFDPSIHLAVRVDLTA
jgi:predicted phage tail protein